MMKPGDAGAVWFAATLRAGDQSPAMRDSDSYIPAPTRSADVRDDVADVDVICLELVRSDSQRVLERRRCSGYMVVGRGVNVW